MFLLSFMNYKIQKWNTWIKSSVNHVKIFSFLDFELHCTSKYFPSVLKQLSVEEKSNITGSSDMIGCVVNFIFAWPQWKTVKTFTLNTRISRESKRISSWIACQMKIVCFFIIDLAYTVYTPEMMKWSSVCLGTSYWHLVKCFWFTTKNIQEKWNKFFFIEY